MAPGFTHLIHGRSSSHLRCFDLLNLLDTFKEPQKLTYLQRLQPWLDFPFHIRLLGLSGFMAGNGFSSFANRTDSNSVSQLARKLRLPSHRRAGGPQIIETDRHVYIVESHRRKFQL